MALVNLNSYDAEFGRSLQLPKCNRDACSSKFAPVFNKATKTYYCIPCANRLNEYPHAPPCCEVLTPEQELEAHQKFLNGELYVGVQRLEAWEAANPGYNIRSNVLS